MLLLQFYLTRTINKDFKEIDNSEAVYHNYIPEINSINMEKNKINTKRVNYYTGQESVTDFNGKLVTDTWNIGTGIADKSTAWQRLRLFIMGAKVSGNYKELTNKGYKVIEILERKY